MLNPHDKVKLLKRDEIWLPWQGLYKTVCVCVCVGGGGGDTQWVYM